jgi:GTP-binding protein
MSEFVDEVRVRVQAGSGGAGAVSFHREKHKPRGGPDGGDGGRGGSVVLRATTELGSLAPYVRRRTLRAANGGRGSGNNRKGPDGADLPLEVPVGTVVREAPTGEILADLAKPGAEYTVGRGGRGGRGNASLRGRHDRLPNYAEQGEPGEEIDVVLELHLVADVGLLGVPNAGKSTLLGAISRADPKIADYPFTTLVPGLGVVDGGAELFTVADLPGLIEGASTGKGLGLRFLRHAERCGVLAVVVDLGVQTPVADLSSVVDEVERYDPQLKDRARVVVGNKIDLPDADEEAARRWAGERGASFVVVSAKAGTNLDELVEVLAEAVAEARAERGAPETFAVFRPVAEDPVQVTREDGAFRVRSRRAQSAVEQTPMDNPRAVRRLQQRLRALGVESALKREGVKEGDEIRIGDVAFEYVPDDAHA